MNEPISNTNRRLGALEETTRLLWGEVNKFDRVVWMSRGYVLARGAMIGAVIAGFLWVLSHRFDREDATNHELRQLIDQLIEKQHALEVKMMDRCGDEKCPPTP